MIRQEWRSTRRGHGEASLLEPHHSYLFNDRAWAYFKKGEPAKGLPDADQAIGLAPRNAAAYDTRGHIHEAADRKEAAIADFKKALELRPDIKSSHDGLKRLTSAN